MFLKTIKSNSVVALAMPVLFAVAIWASVYFIHGQANAASGVPMFDVFLGWLSKWPFLSFIMGLSLVILEAYMWNAFINKQALLKQSSWFPAIFYAFLCSSGPVLIGFYPALVASLFLILALKKLAGSYKKEKALSEAFDAGIFIGIASLIYFPVAIFILFLWIGLFTMRSIVWRELVVSLTGFLLPFAFTLGFYALFYKPEKFWYDNLLAVIGKHPASPVLNWQQIALTGILLLMLLISLFVFLSKFGDNVVKNQKLSSLILWFTCFAAATIIISPERDARALALLILPVSFIFSKYFMRAKSKILPQALFILLLAAIVINVFF